MLTAISYPVLIYAGLTLVRPRTLAIILAVLLLAHGVATWRQRGLAQVSRLVLLPVVVVLLLAALFNQGQFFLLVPVLINLVLLTAFGRTLLWGPPMVETFARLRGRELPDEEVVYCRVVTALWCLFFALNGGVTLWLALGATLAWWTFYTGVVSYALLGILSAEERVRQRPIVGSEPPIAIDQLGREEDPEQRVGDDPRVERPPRQRRAQREPQGDPPVEREE